jgi:putative redox protein
MANIESAVPEGRPAHGERARPRDFGGPAGRRRWSGPRPTPVELFVVGSAAYVGFYAECYLRRHDLDPTGLVVECEYDFSRDGASRLSDIRISVTAPHLPEGRLEPFDGVIEHCTVHNSLVRPPTVRMESFGRSLRTAPAQANRDEQRRSRDAGRLATRIDGRAEARGL